jgi:hypothetical protein
MTIDTSINIGHIITLITVFIAVVTWGSGLRSQVSNLDKRMEDVETEIKTFVETYIATRVMDNKLDDLSRRVVVLENRHPISGRKPHLMTD